MTVWTIPEATKEFPVGAKVKYYPLIANKKNFLEGTVTSEPWIVCGEVVLKVSGTVGGLSIDHLELSE
ncbi:hypothetical protein [uncultured Aliivibrio sp.]|uniref:hypothetical protein n=1 Tax=Aliivibrio salmonicida TaxID=40269 RepID=UPI0026153393|nr:hypothetical protein [uncultured Aliivibrio sp.]